ncbi:MAG: hypothetical protein ING19_06590, partial [Azospirillum sp.]|nr:hypothetical protein [Azospirillum sp.]
KLSVIAAAERSIAEAGGKVDWNAVSMSDRAAFETMASGNTLGVFQLESFGMKDSLAKIKPDKIDDIVAIVSLYRPGPMAFIPSYAQRKNDPVAHPIVYEGEIGERKIPLPFDLLHPILKDTYGIIVYQEQVMELARKVAGYSLGEADLLRRAMGKKIKEEMDKQRTVFTGKAVANGTLTEEQAESLFNLIARFADYGFNKSHAAAYAVIAYRTAWLKAHHPAHFYAASMSYEMDSAEKLVAFRREARRFVGILPPDINMSGAEFRVENGDVRWALGAMKGMGGAAAAVLDVRSRGGKFASPGDFATRMAASGERFTTAQLETLVDAGAFDALEPNRARAFEEAKRAFADWKKAASKGRANTRQASLFGGADMAPRLPPGVAVAERSSVERGQREKKAFGFWFSRHPVDKFADIAAAIGAAPSLVEVTQRLDGAREDEDLRAAFSKVKANCVVEEVLERISMKTNEKFAFIKFADGEGQLEMPAFRGYAAMKPLLSSKDVPLTIEAGVKWEADGSYRLILNKVESLEDLRVRFGDPIYIRLKDGVDPRAIRTRLVDRARAWIGQTDGRRNRPTQGICLIGTGSDPANYRPVRDMPGGTGMRDELRTGFLLEIAADPDVQTVRDGDFSEGRQVVFDAAELDRIMRKRNIPKAGEEHARIYGKRGAMRESDLDAMFGDGSRKTGSSATPGARERSVVSPTSAVSPAKRMPAPRNPSKPSSILLSRLANAARNEESASAPPDREEPPIPECDLNLVPDYGPK